MLDTIASSTRKPGTYIGFDTRRALSSLPANPQRVLVIGQRMAAGSVAALVPTAVFRDTDAADYFGFGSPAHLMARAVIRANPYADLSVIALDEAGGSAAATGTFTVTGPATGPGVAGIRIGARKIEVAVAADAVQNDIAAALNTALGLVTDLPLTAGVAANVITGTCKVKGTVGNSIPISAYCTAPGVVIAVVAMANGAVDPDIQDALDIVFAVRYHLIASQFNDADSLAALKTHLDSVSGKIEGRGARGVFGLTGSLAAATSLAPDINASRIDAIFLRGAYRLPCELAAAFTGYRASIDDPALPLDDDILPGIEAPLDQSQFLSRTEQESCLHNGVTPLEVRADGLPHIVRSVTTYVTNETDDADPTLLDDTTITSLDYTRDVMRAIPKPKKGSARRAKGFRTLILDRLYKLEKAEILQDIDKYKDQVIVDPKPADREPGWWKVSIPAPVVPGLHVLDETIVLYL